MKHIYISTLLITAILCSSAAWAKSENRQAKTYGLNGSYESLQANYVLPKGDIYWKSVDTGNISLSHQTTLLHQTSATPEWYSISKNIDNIPPQTSFTHEWYERELTQNGFVLNVATHEDRFPKNRIEERSDSIPDSASILLFCFGVGITSLTSMRKKFIKAHYQH